MEEFACLMYGFNRVHCCWDSPSLAGHLRWENAQRGIQLRVEPYLQIRHHEPDIEVLWRYAHFGCCRMGCKLPTRVLLGLFQRIRNTTRQVRGFLSSFGKGSRVARLCARWNVQFAGPDTPVSYVFEVRLSLLFSSLTYVSDFKDLRNATHFGLGNISVDVVTAIANISVALYFSWKLTLVILASVPISIIILAILGGKIDQALELQKQQLALASRQAASAVTAIDMVKVCNGADQEIWQYSEYVKRSMQAHLVQSRIYSLQGSYVKLWLECLFAVAFYYGARLQDQGLSSGDLVTTFYAALNGLRAMEAIVMLCPVISRGSLAGQCLQTITTPCDRETTAKHVSSCLPSERCYGAIEFRGVS